ncbi:ABC transporter permease [Desulfosporosinus meridiei]|uniref:ABC-type dipeptide/oligopeptide/nickel transport system, permease component n=1 Tax=Desulfosporosinus meridiei (strain ATCC BAA-275 / DSM 13257 / KCTC 12902 / NCIMB 13706 / S10) TaxID=768704 RepID=J7J5J7_DESMD|nr:ABC transporter permease [Desulfosporosinus meridiei]AFQ46216.1 ABC-type dipeptide/oligopeptide/nickel transport system, permease component [Desulfosporosinus meridiei DSM 13257]
MLKYILKRILMLIPVLIGVSIIVFLIMRVFSPDPAPIVLGQHATQQTVDAWRQANGLNDPIYLQYFNYLQGALTGDLGTSYYTKTSVTKEILTRFPATIELALVAIVLASIFGIIIGVISAVKKNSIFDNAGMLLALVGVSMPIFWLGILLIILFSGVLHWLPSNGRIDPLLQPIRVTGFYLVDSLMTGNMDAFKDALRHIILPASALAMYSMAIITRMTRSSMLDTLQQDYIRTARAKGIDENRVIVRHALRNGLIPIITVIGLQLGSLLGGAVLTETVFSWPGIGAYTVACILKSDFPVVQGVVLLVATIFVLMNLLVDVVYGFLDPRIKYSKKEV